MSAAIAVSGPYARISAAPAFEMVAHAGGGIDGYTGTNSLEAIRASADRGDNTVEIDFIKTTDGRVVCAHDWVMSARVPFAPDSAVTLAEFSRYRIYDKFTPLSLDSLALFLITRPDVTVITDTKYGDYTALATVAKEYPNMRARFIPQVYSFEDYSRVKALGYDRVIVTLYAMTLSVKSNIDYVVKSAKGLGVYAVTIPDTILTAEYAQALNRAGIRFYSHTVNDPVRADTLRSLGAAGVYTDTLTMGSVGAEPHMTGEAPMTAVLERYGVRYVPIAALARAYGAENYAYHPDEGAITFDYKGRRYKFVAGKSAAVYREWFYVPQNTAENIFR
jgi:glycerophosphoryl diester phosphodiesterase